ncbi:hypothetical protein CCH79_00017313, partial [Gambusia affinis]
SLNEALKAISVSTELIEEELKPHLDTVLTALLEKKKDAAAEIVRSGILPTLAQALRSRSSLSCKVALLVAEMAREAAVREPCIKAGLVKALVPHLNSSDQEMLLNTGRAIGRICFDNTHQQDQLVQSGVIPRLVSIMKEYPDNDPLVNTSASKSEAMVLSWERVEFLLQVGKEVLPQVGELKYLGVLYVNEGKMEREIARWIGAGSAVKWVLY